MERKYLPVGMDDFKKLIEKNCYFIDKSLFIKELLSNRSEITLIPRPRRFGKSLNMSMLKYFFDIEKSDENRKLFKGLKIESTDFMKYQGQYPVIYLSFKELKMDNWEECLEQLKEILSDLYKSHSKVKECLDPDSLADFNEITSGKGSKIKFMNSISRLSKYMSDFYGKKVIILIDEYDTPLTTAHLNGYYDEAISFFRNFLSGAYKSNINLEFGVMTGITRVAKESIFSGLNNLKVATILDSNYQYFGLTELEVEELLKYYGLDYELEQIKWWYNGYRFGGIQMYNPWSIINFADNNDLKAYWINSSDNMLIKNILKKNDSKIQNDLENLFRGESIEEALKETLVFEEMEKIDTIWSLLFFTGYLTYNRKNTSSITGATTYDLIIPNQEVRTFFRDVFIAEYSDNQSS
ncbi:MAG: AAA family ATPase, partial [Fusobacteriaceae bacterium]